MSFYGDDIIAGIYSPVYVFAINMGNKKSSFHFVASFSHNSPSNFILSQSKAMPVTGRGRPYGFKRMRLPHFQDNLLRGGGEAVSLTRRPPSNSQEDFWYSCVLEAKSSPGPK
jgi:hypothetical protein